jgi:hypothetical protein
MLGAMVPLTTGIPGVRNLGLVSLGMMGLIGQLFEDVASNQIPDHLNKFQIFLFKFAFTIILIINLIIPPYSIVSKPKMVQADRDYINRLTDFGNGTNLEEKHLLVINPPGTLFYSYSLIQRVFDDLDLHASINFLSSGYNPIHIERVDTKSIIVTPEGGYSPQPSSIIDDKFGRVKHFSQENISRILDGVFYNPQDPMQKGQEFALNDLTVKITKMSIDDRIAQALFTFDLPLEDSRYVWLVWDENTFTYYKVLMPEVGKSRIFVGDFTDQWDW